LYRFCGEYLGVCKGSGYSPYPNSERGSGFVRLESVGIKSRCETL
jgi:hypothetical protein